MCIRDSHDIKDEEEDEKPGARRSRSPGERVKVVMSAVAPIEPKAETDPNVATLTRTSRPLTLAAVEARERPPVPVSPRMEDAGWATISSASAAPDRALSATPLSSQSSRGALFEAGYRRSALHAPLFSPAHLSAFSPFAAHAHAMDTHRAAQSYEREAAMAHHLWMSGGGGGGATLAPRVGKPPPAAPPAVSSSTPGSFAAPRETDPALLRVSATRREFPWPTRTTAPDVDDEPIQLGLSG